MAAQIAAKYGSTDVALRQLRLLDVGAGRLQAPGVRDRVQQANVQAGEPGGGVRAAA